jgi:SAM-dependent methyltransferase
MELQKELLCELMRRQPFQPATSTWRSVELSNVLAWPFPTKGLGLDIGCGDGLLMDLILERVRPRPSVVGIDIDPLETTDAQRMGVYERVHACPGEKIPEGDASFDFAFSNSVLEHIPDLDGVLQEVSRVLKTGASFLFTVPGPDFHRCLRGPLWPGAARQAYLDRLDRRVAHLRYPTESQWKEMLSRHGMRLERTQSYMGVKQVRRWEFVANLTAGVLYAVWRGRKRPIEIQRSLGMRRQRRQIPRALARLAATVLSLGISSEPREGPYGCLMILAVKQ